MNRGVRFGLITAHWSTQHTGMESRAGSSLIKDKVFNLFDRDCRFGSKVSQIGPKWDKFGPFSDQISVHLAPGRQMH